jgi:MazG family protein
MKLSRGQGEANRTGANPVSAGDAAGLRPGLDGLRDLMARLLADEGGCAWDRAQTLDTLRPFLLEETHEVLESMDDPGEHCGELGDLLFQIVFQAALREKDGSFDLDDVIDGITEKLVRRHPHIFGDASGETLDAAAVERQWAEIKARERQGQPDDPLARIPRGLPAIARAAKIQRAAADLGFDWPDLEGAMAKVREECDELDAARQHGQPAAIREELGDLLFVMVRVAQKVGVDADDALRRANAKFERRFGEVLRRCRAAGIDPKTAGLPVLDALWTAAKADEPEPG